MPTGIYKRTEEQKTILRKNLAIIHKKRIGTKFPKEWLENSRKGHLGQKAWNKGLTKLTDERVLKYSNSKIGHKHSEETKALIGKNTPKRTDAENYNWAGDKIKYRGLHIWVEKILGKPNMCEYCKKGGLSGHKINWANKSKKYKREPNDWVRLCVPCHRKYDHK